MPICEKESYLFLKRKCGNFIERYIVGRGDSSGAL